MLWVRDGVDAPCVAPVSSPVTQPGGDVSTRHSSLATGHGSSGVGETTMRTFCFGDEADPYQTALSPASPVKLQTSIPEARTTLVSSRQCLESRRGAG